jgi:hypothetical protein
VVGFVLLLLTLRPLAHLLSTLETFALMQYPWRFLGPASAAAVLALSGLASPAPSFSAGGRPRGGWLAAAILALAVLGDGFAFSGAASRAAPWQGLAVPADKLFATGVVRFETVPKPWPQRSFGIFLPPWECCADVAEVYSEYSEYFTPAARRTAARFAEAGIGQVMRAAGELEPIDALPYARLWRPGAGTPRALRYQRGGGRIEVRIPRGAHGRLEVAEQNFPGWRVERRGEWTDVAATDSGLLAVDVPRGTRRIRFEFHRWTWEKNLGRILSLATALGLGLLLVRARRPRASPAEAA